MQPIPVKHATVFGGGAFGTALSFVLARKGARVKTWLIDPKEAKEVEEKRVNNFYLKGIRLHSLIHFTSDVADALQDTEIVILAIPTQFLNSFLQKNKDALPKDGTPIVIACKGIELGTLRTPHEIVLSHLPKENHKNVAVLAGPSFAKEVAHGQFTAVAIASEDMTTAHKVQMQVTLDDGSFRAYATSDVIGAEIASAVKNVLAIASGAAQGMGMGRNARAALISRGLLELTQLARALGSTTVSLTGLAGIGDLLLTCSSELSRNFTVGLRLGQGETLEKIKQTMKAVAEGVPTSKALFELSKKVNVRMPICYQVYQVLYNGRDVREAFFRLVQMPLQDEDVAAELVAAAAANPKKVQPSKL